MKYPTLLFAAILMFSCKKKDTNENNNNNDDALVHFYSAPANSPDAVLLIGLDSAKTYALIANAAFNSSELHTRINSLVFGNISDNYYGNLILDDDKRPGIFYLTARNGDKDKVLLSFSYPAKDTVVYRLYYYDWASQKDSLLQEQHINVNDFSSIITYGKATPDATYWNRTTTELKTIGDYIEQVFNNEIMIKEASDTRFDTKNIRGFFNNKKKTTNNGTVFFHLQRMIEESEMQARIQETFKEPVKLSDFKVAEDQSFANYATEMLAIGSPTDPKKSIPHPGGTPQNPSGSMLAGIWTLDLTLGIGNCDETMLEDEAHIPPTLHFNPDWTITFDTDPVESDLNGSDFTNGYDIGLDGTYNDVKIWCNYDDGTDNISFQCSLHYDNTTKKYTGTYTNQWTDGALCSGNVVMYK